MSAMQERGREHWVDALCFDEAERSWAEGMADEILAFAAEREAKGYKEGFNGAEDAAKLAFKEGEAKARREAVEEERTKWLAATKKVWPFTNHLSDCKLEPDTCGFGEATKPLLDLVWPKDSPATEKCEHSGDKEVSLDIDITAKYCSICRRTFSL